jgi:hypothetical protein
MRKKRFLLMILAAALMALPALAQTFGANQAEQPNAAFQSTSTLSGSGSSYSANPTLNSDCTATYQNAAPSKVPAGSGPHKSGPINPGQNDPKEGPLGDALLPLLFMSLAFGMFVYFRRKRSAA